MGLENDYYRCPICEEWGNGCNCLREYEREGYQERQRDELQRVTASINKRLRRRDCE